MSLFKGRKAERHAEKYLKKQGFSLIIRNYFCSMGEIDLIMHDGDELVFIEVRARKNKNYGTAAESINASKQQKICKTARFYLHQNPQFLNKNCRFDVVEINNLWESKMDIQWIKDAFWLNEQFSIL